MEVNLYIKVSELKGYSWGVGRRDGLAPESCHFHIRERNVVIIFKNAKVLPTLQLTDY